MDCSLNASLTHWGWVMHICIGKLTIIGSHNGLAPGQRQTIIWTNAGILLIQTLGTNFCEILREIHDFSFKKMHLKMSSAKWRQFCLGLNVLNYALVYFITLTLCNSFGWHFSFGKFIWYLIALEVTNNMLHDWLTSIYAFISWCIFVLCEMETHSVGQSFWAMSLWPAFKL